MKEQLSDLFGRKMIMFYLSWIGVFVLMMLGKMGEDTFMFVFGWIISNFVIGNVAEWKYKTSTITGMTATDQNKVNFKRD